MQAQTQFAETLLSDPERLSRLVLARADDHEVVHEPNEPQPLSGERNIERVQVDVR